MINWLRKRLGVEQIERELRLSIIWRIERIEAHLDIASNAINRIDKKMRTRRRPQRYDEIERDRKRRCKGST